MPIESVFSREHAEKVYNLIKDGSESIKRRNEGLEAYLTIVKRNQNIKVLRVLAGKINIKPVEPKMSK